MIFTNGNTVSSTFYDISTMALSDTVGERANYLPGNSDGSSGSCSIYL
jgi:hypothetical protein